jgi:hypothetical protein
MLLADYTWSKFMSNDEAYTTFLEASTVGGIEDFTNLRGERSLLSLDVPNRAIISYVMELPFGANKRFLSNASGVTGRLVSGWSVAGITTFASGFPLVITSAAPNYLSTYFGAGTIRPNVVAGCNKSLGDDPGSGLPVINAACFSAPGPLSFRNESRVDPHLSAAGINNGDFTLAKLMRIRESVALDFRGELFNIFFNHVQFGPPNTSSGNPFFGRVTSQLNTPRQIQLSLRLNF